MFSMLQTQNAFVIHIEKQAFSIVIIEIFKFLKMCIYMFNGSNINNVSFEKFNL